jgi:rare lipoprotein A
MKQVALSVLAMVAVLSVAGCAEKGYQGKSLAEDRPPALTAPAEPTTAPAKPQVPAVAGTVYRETGTASWYGRDFQGRKTASGELYDMNGLSAAHRILPLGTVIRVINLDNYKSIEVAVNDRGPLVKSRVLEVSYGAAKELGFVAQGTTRIKIEAVEPISDEGTFTVVVAAFREEENAKLLRERLTQRYEVVAITPFTSNTGTFYRVRVGNYPSEEKAERIAAKLTLEGLEPVVVRKD